MKKLGSYLLFLRKEIDAYNTENKLKGTEEI